MQLVRTWALLALLTGLSTLMHLSGLPAHIAGGCILLIAWIKARLILLDYLELRGVQGWAGGILFVLAGFVALLLILFLVA